MFYSPDFPHLFDHKDYFRGSRASEAFFSLQCEKWRIHSQLFAVSFGFGYSQFISLVRNPLMDQMHAEIQVSEQYINYINIQTAGKIKKKA